MIAKRLIKSLNTIIRNRSLKSTVRVLAVIVVFVTTYLLILPAMTLDADTAAEQGGIDVPAATEESGEPEQVQEASEQQGEPAQPESGSETKHQSKPQTENSEGPKTRSGPTDISYDGNGFKISVDPRKESLPDDTELDVKEISKSEDRKEYKSLLGDALEAVRKEDGTSKKPSYSFALFYDISLMSGGEAIEPDSTVNVTIEYDKTQRKDLQVSDPDKVRIVHFAVDKDTGKIEPEVLSSNDVNVDVSKDKLAAASFDADSFSVYAVIYTVDFEYGGNGGTFTIGGGDSVSLGELTEQLGITAQKADETKPATADFLEEVEKVEFSDPKLINVHYFDKDGTVADVMTEEKLYITYPLGLTQEEVLKLNHKEYKAGEWVLISVKPFD